MLGRGRLAVRNWTTRAPLVAAGLAFVVLFWQPAYTLGRDWWNDSEVGHGLLLFVVALYLAWRRGLVRGAASQSLLGLGILAGAVLLRWLAGLAVELFTMRLAMFVAVAGLLVFYRGLPQLRHWWLPATLLVLAIPLPAVVLNTLALPLQLEASELGAALLETRRVPVRLAGNVIMLPGTSLFVTEACSGLRSLNALVALSVLMGGLWLQVPWTRMLLLAVALPVAVAVNGVRVFVTGLLTYYVDRSWAEGFMHLSEGWVMFVGAFGALGGVLWLLRRVERLRQTARKGGLSPCTLC